MATAALNVEEIEPQIPSSEEPTKDAPSRKEDAAAVSDADKKKILELVNRYKTSWFWKRRAIVKRVLKSKEFAKGNQFIGFDPDTFQWFDAVSVPFLVEGRRAVCEPILRDLLVGRQLFSS